MVTNQIWIYYISLAVLLEERNTRKSFPIGDFLFRSLYFIFLCFCIWLLVLFKNYFFINYSVIVFYLKKVFWEKIYEHIIFEFFQQVESISSSKFHKICPKVLRLGLNEKSFYLKMLKKCYSQLLTVLSAKKGKKERKKSANSFFPLKHNNYKKSLQLWFHKKERL